MDTNKKIKVLFLSHLSTCGGAQNVLYLLLKGINLSIFEPIVVLPSEGVLKEKIDLLGIKTYIFELSWWINIQNSFGEFFDNRLNSLIELIQKENIDIVLTNTSVIIEGALAAQICSIPHIWYIHELISLDPDLIPIIDLYSFGSIIDHFSDKIIVVSEAVKSDLTKIYNSNKISVTYTGFEDNNYFKLNTNDHNKIKKLNINNQTPVVTYVGDLSIRKGVLTLVDTAKEVLEKFPDVQFVVVGSLVGLYENLKQKLEEENIYHAFHFLGFRHDAYEIIGVSNMLILPSVADPLPVVVLEAMANGKPVVATCSGGTEEMIIEGQTGLLCPVGDSKQMAQAIISLLNNPSQMKTMGVAALERLKKHFSYKQYISEFEENFLEVFSKEKEVKKLTPELTVTLSNLIKTAAKVKTLEQEVETLKQEVEHFQNIIAGMEKSFFWKMRNKWFKLKKNLNLKDNR